MFFRCLNMGSTLSAPCAYLQKHGWPWMGIPASREIFLSCSVKDLEEQVRDPECTAGATKRARPAVLSSGHSVHSTNPEPISSSTV